MKLVNALISMLILILLLPLFMLCSAIIGATFQTADTVLLWWTHFTEIWRKNG